LKPKNEPIGIVACPMRDCDRDAQIFKFRQRTGRGSPFTGKLYVACPVHGRLLTDGGAAGQEYILTHGSIDSPGGTSQGAEPAPEPAPPPKTEAPRVSAPTRPAPAPAAPAAPARRPSGLLID